MSLPPRNPWEHPRDEEEESWWDLLGAVFEPLGEVAVYAAICIIGGGLIVASRWTPFIPLAVGVVAVIVSVYVASRHAARAGHRGDWPLIWSSPRCPPALSPLALDFSTYSGSGR
jgi:hypothetical protein